MTPTQAQIRPVPGETLDDLRTIAAGLLADGLDVSKLSNVGRAELRQAIDRILALAAAQVGEPVVFPHGTLLVNATIERCAQVAEEPFHADGKEIATAIRNLKEV